MTETKILKITIKGTKGSDGTVAQFWKQLTEFGDVKVKEVKLQDGGGFKVVMPQ